MSAPVGDLVGVGVSSRLEATAVPVPIRVEASPHSTGRRRFLPLAMATTLATLALAVGGPSAASAATPHPMVRSWSGSGFAAVPDELQQADVVAIDGGGTQALALTSDGKVTSWGDSYGGPPSSLQDKKVIAISAGYSHSLAVTDDGKIVGWGDNSDGKAVLPAYLARFRFTAVAAGGTQSLGLTTDGLVIPWGGTSHNETAMPTALNGKQVTAIATGFSHNLALTSDGQVAAWGDGYQEGVYAVPALQGQTVVAVAAGTYADVALTSEGRVIGFGPEARYSDVPAAAQNDIIAIAASGGNIIALNKDHQVVAWQFDPPPSTALSKPVPVPMGVANSRVSLLGAGNGFNLTVGVPNSPSTANDQQLSTAYQQPVDVTLTATNEADSVLTYAVQDQPQHGTLSGTAPNLTYTPSKRYSGTDTFTYVADDGNTESAPATVSIAVDARPTPPTVTPPTKQFVVDTNGLHHSRSITSKKVTVAKDDELLVAFVSANGPAGKKQTITQVSGGGLDWKLVERGNAGVGTSEVWQAYAREATPAFRVKAAFGRSGYSSKITVAGFTDASGAGAVTAHASGKGSAPTVTLVPESSNSVVWAAGRVIGDRYDPRPASGTRIVHDVGISHPRVGYWVQKSSARTIADEPVTISDNLATRYPWGMTAVEIHGAVYL